MPSVILYKLMKVEDINMKILIAEDNPDLRDLYRDTFIDAGYEVLTARDGEEGLKILKENPDISHVMSDVLMSDSLDPEEPKNGPGMFHNSLQEEGISKNIKYLIVTGRETSGVYRKQELRLVGIGFPKSAILQKPVDCGHLPRAVELAPTGLELITNQSQYKVEHI